MAIFMRFPGGKKKALTLSYDDGVEQDIRLIEILQKYGLKGTFNINSGCYAPEGTVYPEGTIHRRMTKKQATEVYTDSGMEVAVHGLTHPFLEQLPVNLCLNEVAKDRANLEEQFATIIRGMAYPFATYNEDVINCLKCAGIVYSRTANSTGDFRLPSDWLLLDPTCHHNDPRLMELAQRFVEEDIAWTSRLFYVWGHSYEFDAKDNWDVIEKFAAYTGCKDDIWYATNIEIYEYMSAYQELVYSMDGHSVFNPTAFTFYLEKDGEEHCVRPGERIKI